MSPPDRPLATACRCLLFAGLTAGRLFADTPPVGPTVHLPTVTVTESALPSEEKPWHYCAIRGFEILSQTPDAVTATLAGHLVNFADMIDRIYSGVHNLREPRIHLVLCAQRDLFESFIPAKVRTEFGSEKVNRLFFEDNKDGPRIVVYAGPAERVGAYEVDLSRAYLAARLRGTFPRLPAWYVEGISRIYAAVQVSELGKRQTIAVGKLDDRVKGDAADVSDGLSVGNGTLPDPARGLSSEVQEVVQGDVLGTSVKQARTDGVLAVPVDPDGRDLTFMKYFADSVRPCPPLPDMFSQAPAVRYLDWAQGCGLFVHFCLFGEFYAKREEALVNFIVTSSKSPSGDGSAEFQAAFKASYAEVGKELGFYSSSVSYRVKKYTFPKPPEPSVEVRPATEGETADIKSQALACAGLPERAEAVLVSAYNRSKAGAPDPRLVAALGIWDADHGRTEQADSLLALGAAKKYPEPRLYVDLARRRLERAVGGRPLTAAETTDCLEPLELARGMGATDGEVYGLMAAIWLKSAELPATANLQELLEGIREFPADGDLAYDAARAFLRAGVVSPAKAIIQREIATGDTATRQRFAALQAGPGK